MVGCREHVEVVRSIVSTETARAAPSSHRIATRASRLLGILHGLSDKAHLGMGLQIDPTANRQTDCFPSLPSAKLLSRDAPAVKAIPLSHL
jgi:hypothetical protein